MAGIREDSLGHVRKIATAASAFIVALPQSIIDCYDWDAESDPLVACRVAWTGPVDQPHSDFCQRVEGLISTNEYATTPAGE